LLLVSEPLRSPKRAMVADAAFGTASVCIGRGGVKRKFGMTPE
jgi:hypothetical protein